MSNTPKFHKGQLVKVVASTWYPDNKKIAWIGKVGEITSYSGPKHRVYFVDTGLFYNLSFNKSDLEAIEPEPKPSEAKKLIEANWRANPKSL